MVSQRLFKQFIAFCCDKNTELEITTMYKIKHIKHIELCFRPTRKAKKVYSKEPKSVTAFNEFTFFHADIDQSEVEDSFQLASDWIKFARKNVN